MTAENQRSPLLIVVLCAALVLCLGVAVSPLVWLFSARPRFQADDARMRIVFQVNLEESADDPDAVLESVRQTIDQRLNESWIVPGFLVRAAG